VYGGAPRQALRFLAWRGTGGATAREVARMLAAGWVRREAARYYLGDDGRAAAVSHGVTATHRSAPG